MLDKIVNNPFRILGVYANARPAEIVSNCDDMEAYITIGQSLSFDLDFNNLMPQVLRTADSVSNAKKQINLPKDKLMHALFWFIKDSSSAHAVNYLKKGDFDNAYEVFDIEESFASRINKAVAALIQNDDLGLAIANITEIIHDSDDLGLRDDFVKSICGDAFSITEDELAHLYIDTLLEEKDAQELLNLFIENGVSQDDDDYLKEKVINEPISRINAEIAKAKAVQRDDADANYRAGKALMNNTKSDLALVKKLLGATDMKYQILADDLADAILQCGVNYYNNTQDDDSIDKTMVLQKYACKIAVGKMCKDRCNQNVAILEKRKEEEAIGIDLLFIVNEIQSYQIKEASIENARNLVNNTVPHLNNIKSKLGSSNEVYLQVSSAVANNAMGMLITVINNAQKVSMLSLHVLQSQINSAISVMNLIGGLDMISTERSRYNTNMSSLSKLKLSISALAIGSTQMEKPFRSAQLESANAAAALEKVRRAQMGKSNSTQNSRDVSHTISSSGSEGSDPILTRSDIVTVLIVLIVIALFLAISFTELL